MWWWWVRRWCVNRAQDRIKVSVPMSICRSHPTARAACSVTEKPARNVHHRSLRTPRLNIYLLTRLSSKSPHQNNNNLNAMARSEKKNKFQKVMSKLPHRRCRCRDCQTCGWRSAPLLPGRRSHHQDPAVCRKLDTNARQSARNIAQLVMQTNHCGDGVGGRERRKAGQNDVEVIAPGHRCRRKSTPAHA